MKIKRKFQVDFNNVPNEDYQKWWLKIYLSPISESVSNELVNKWYNSVQYMLPMSHLLWGVWSLMQAEISEIDFDFIEYAKLRLDEYHKLSAKLNFT